MKVIEIKEIGKIKLMSINNRSFFFFFERLLIRVVVHDSRVTVSLVDTLIRGVGPLKRKFFHLNF